MLWASLAGRAEPHKHLDWKLVLSTSVPHNSHGQDLQAAGLRTSPAHQCVYGNHDQISQPVSLGPTLPTSEPAAIADQPQQKGAFTHTENTRGAPGSDD